MIITCPAPAPATDTVLMAHGSGGKLGQDLIGRVFVSVFDDPILSELEDQATVEAFASGRMAITTDAFVIDPIFFPGGDIGKLAVCGTVNDLAVGGAIPRYLSAAFILEEGLAIADLEKIAASMKRTADEVGVRIVTGDTKVVERGKADRVFITTTGVGVVPVGRRLSAGAVTPGDVVLVSGTVGDHGIAIMSVREGVAFETALESDCASVVSLVAAVLDSGARVRCMRDPTRGGVSAVLHEIGASSGVGFAIDEARVPVREEVAGACEMLGLDPLYVANEGKLVLVVDGDDGPQALDALRGHPLGRDAAIIGHATAEHPKMVVVRSIIGGQRIAPLPLGEQLPRIC